MIKYYILCIDCLIVADLLSCKKFFTFSSNAMGIVSGSRNLAELFTNTDALPTESSKAQVFKHKEFCSTLANS
jgi:hypothetical protein